MTIRLLATVLLATLVTAACAGSAAEFPTPTTDTTLASLTADDRAEILDLAGRYSHGIDLKDSAAWEGVFTEDGVMELVSQGIEITGEAASIVFQGRYEDQLRRVDGRWRIAYRRILTDWIQPTIAEGLAARQ